MSPRFRLLGAAVLTITLGLTVAACGSSTPRAGTAEDLSTTPSARVTSTPAADAEVIAITLSGSTVDPSGRKVEIRTGQPVVLRIDAAKAGELHVHSSPEKHVSFPAGSSEITLTFADPGVVDVEDHDLDALIVRLEVR